MRNRLPRAGRSAAARSGAGTGFGLPSREVDGSDFFDVYEAAGEAIDRARSGAGPSLLHVRLNRYYGHFEGDAMTYRAPDEVANARLSDPLILFRQRVVEASLLGPGDFEAADKEATSHVAHGARRRQGGAHAGRGRPDDRRLSNLLEAILTLSPWGRG